ncbi:6625_t:CDS:1, partial [Acaulospora morrowiae]
RTRLDINKLEDMAKIRLYYIANMESELNNSEEKLTEIELCEAINISAINEIMALNKNEDLLDFEELSENMDSTQDMLLINNIIDLFQYSSENEKEINTNTSIESGNLNYLPENL